MATNNKNKENLACDVDDDPTQEFEIPTGLRRAAGSHAPEIELDENTYDIDESSDPSGNLSKLELKTTVRTQVERIGNLEYELELLTSRHRGTSEELKAREEIANALNDEAVQARDALETAETAQLALGEEHETLTSALDELSERASRLDVENVDLREQLALSVNEANLLGRTLSSQELQLRDLEADLQSANLARESQLSIDKESSQRTTELASELDGARTELADLRDYVDRRKAEWDKQNSELSNLPSRTGANKNQGRESSNKVERLEADIAAAQARLEDTKERLKQ